MEEKLELNAQFTDTIIRFEEGLIGFSECKSFVLMENDAIKPFRRLQSTEREEIGFLVVDPSLIVRDFTEFIPGREWEALGVRDKAARLALAICIIGPSLAESSGNLQAPVIINYQTMTGRQIILTEAPVSPRQPLL